MVDGSAIDELAGWQEGHFRKGSMGTKVRAILRFWEHGGREGVIASLDKVLDAVEGKTGTRLVRR